MAERATIDEKLCRSKIKTPPKWFYSILMLITRLLNFLSNTHITYKAYPGKDPSNIVMIANHASRVDYQFTGPVCMPKMLNYMVGYNEFFRFPTNIILPYMQVIPKKNFTPDTNTIRKVLNVAKQGGNICFMPEGMSSITGMTQPVIPGGAKLLKKLGLPVYYSKISGGYMTYTKHCLDMRKGRIEVTVDRMFTAEQLASMSVPEIEDRMNRLLAHDDYIWNKEKQYHFKGNGKMAKNLGDLLYLCPKCGEVYKMKCSGNRMSCTACGNTVELDECYNLRPVGDSVCPELVTDWTILERDRAAAEVRKPDFAYCGHVMIGVLPEHKPLMGDATSIISGDGMLKLDKDGLHFDGTLSGAPYKFDIPSVQLPTYGMCTDITRFYTFVDGRFVEFYPDNNDVLLWDHLTEELHRFNGGAWQNTKYRHTP